jgi:hypothetical protein
MQELPDLIAYKIMQTESQYIRQLKRFRAKGNNIFKIFTSIVDKVGQIITFKPEFTVKPD